MRSGRHTLNTSTHQKPFIINIFVALVVLAIVLFSQHCTPAAEPLSANEHILLAKYSTLKTVLENNQFGLPLYLESQEDGESMRVDVYGIFAYTFDSVRDALQVPDPWCDISALLLNIKAATFRKESEQWLLTLYSGRKYYQPPSDAFQVDLSFHIAALQPEYFNVEMTGNKGPLGLRDQRITFKAVSLDAKSTFIHFHYDFTFGALARAAMTSYYSTIGRTKKGFSVSETDKSGNSVYVKGARGSLERTAVRAYFAIQTYMDALNNPENERFEKRINDYYDLTGRFPQQLYEMDKSEYLANKRREHTNQLMLQNNLVN